MGLLLARVLVAGGGITSSLVVVSSMYKDSS